MLLAATIQGLINKVQGEVLNPIIGILFAIATIVFLWGVIQYVIAAGGQKMETGRQVMLWGIIGMFIMASAAGIVKILCNFFGTGC